MPEAEGSAQEKRRNNALTGVQRQLDPSFPALSRNRRLGRRSTGDSRYVTHSAAPRLRLIGGTAVGERTSDPDIEVASDEADLVARTRAGEVAAFEQLYRRHAGFALNLAVRIQGAPADAEDVVHDAFLKAHQALDELRDPRAFRGWLGSIVVRLVRTRLRRRRLLAALGLASREPVDLDSIAAPHADPETRALLAQVYALLDTLPADERIAWTLRYVEHHRLESVAELAECSLATAKRRITRAQAFLTEHFVEAFQDPARGS
jgi:RNA polymerase sigma-70 factor (ECF subfamily)